jgi:hypothetical protein
MIAAQTITAYDSAGVEFSRPGPAAVVVGWCSIGNA